MIAVAGEGGDAGTTSGKGGFGGGINSIELASEILKYGADKIVLNTIAYKKPDLISRVAKLFGSQSIIVSIDAKKDSDRNWICYSHSGTINTGYNVQDWVKKVLKKAL